MSDDTFSNYDVFKRAGIDIYAYKKCHCGANCDMLSSDASRPCWGEVSPHGLSDEADFAHLCEGHSPIYYGDGYKAKE